MLLGLPVPHAVKLGVKGTGPLVGAEAAEFSRANLDLTLGVLN